MKRIPQAELEECKVDYFAEDMDLFWHMIYERQNVFNLKDIERRDPPWTEDEILKNFKFTNVFREQDRGTRFVTDYIFPRCGGNKRKLLFNIFAYRIFNKIETFLTHGIIDPDNYVKEDLVEILRERAKNITVFTNAFVVSGYPFIDGADKIERIGEMFVIAIGSHMQAESVVYDNVLNSMESAYRWFWGINGVGPFLAYQMAVDLSYSEFATFTEKEFVIDGPGAKRGLCRLFPDYEIKRLGYENLNTWLALKWQVFCEELLTKEENKSLFKYRPVADITVMDIENCLCEFSKYSKVLEQSGRPRNKYNQVEGVARARCKERDSEWLMKEYQYDKYNKRHWQPKRSK
jgi:hypothetical protein